MKTSDLAAQCIAAALLMGVTLGSVSLVASRTPSDEIQRALPPSADPSLVVPLKRTDMRKGVDDMLHVGDALAGEGQDEGERSPPSRLSEADPQS